jgi:hypothetical protein
MTRDLTGIPFAGWLNTRTTSLQVIWISVPGVRGAKISKSLHVSENAPIPVGLVQHWRMHLCVQRRQTSTRLLSYRLVTDFKVLINPRRKESWKDQ